MDLSQLEKYQAEYRIVRSLITRNITPTLDMMRAMFQSFELTELPFVKAHTCDARYKDVKFPHITYELNASGGLFRRRRHGNYCTLFTPRKTIKTSMGSYRKYQPEILKNNLPKMMLYCLSTVLAYRINEIRNPSLH